MFIEWYEVISMSQSPCQARRPHRQALYPQGSCDLLATKTSTLQTIAGMGTRCKEVVHERTLSPVLEGEWERRFYWEASYGWRQKDRQKIVGRGEEPPKERKKSLSLCSKKGVTDPTLCQSSLPMLHSQKRKSLPSPPHFSLSRRNSSCDSRLLLAWLGYCDGWCSSLPSSIAETKHSEPYQLWGERAYFTYIPGHTVHQGDQGRS